MPERPLTVDIANAVRPPRAAESIIALVMTETSTALERLGTFPPITSSDWRNMFYDQPLAVNKNAARMVYDVCWFLVKNEDVALDLTVITFRISLSRFNDHSMPLPAGYSAWLASIASNEAHRKLEDSPLLKPSSALLDDGPDRDAHYLADTLAEMRADYKLALLLRYRYDTPSKYLSMALDLRPRKVAQLLVKAREAFAANSSVRPSTFAEVTPPLSKPLPHIVEPYKDREMKRKVLGYDWLDSDFPVIPEREERRARWITLVLTAIILIGVSVAVTQPWSAERPTLIEPDAIVETIDE